MHADLSNSETITLPDFIRENQKRAPGASGEFSDVLLSIALGTKVVSQGVNQAGIASLLGLTGKTNVQGEEVQKLDDYADKVFSSVLGKTGDFFSMVSEERDSVFSTTASGDRARYVIAFDPLDGSSNIDVNVSIGSIWGVYRRVSKGSLAEPNDKDFLQPGRKQIAAGYAIYGSSTMFVFTTGNGVYGFTLDPTIGEFILTNPEMRIPDTGNIYSCNQGNYPQWTKGVQAYVDELQTMGQNGNAPCKHRYVGSFVADFHRTLLKGGIFLYPGDHKNRNGKLRLLYECAPLAFIAEQAGGRATDGHSAIMDAVPNDIHQRTPLFIGSTSMVQRLEKSVAAHGS